MNTENFIIGGINQKELTSQEVPTTTSQTPEAPPLDNVVDPPTETPPQEPTEPAEPTTEATPPTETPATEPQVESPVETTPETTPQPTVEEPQVVPAPALETAPQPTAEPQIQLDDETKKFYEFKKANPEASMRDFMEMQRDWDAVGDIDIIKKQIQEENKGVSLTDAQLNSLIEKKYEVDLSDLSEEDQLTIKLEAGKGRLALKEQQQKFNTPTQTPVQEVVQTPAQANVETVTLSNGDVIEKSVYESARKQYKASIQQAVESMETESYTFEVGSGDEKKTITLDYVVEQQDKQSLLSELNTVPITVLQQFVDDSGNLDYTGLSRAQLMKNEARNKKMVSRLLSLAYAQGQEEVLKQETNVNFNTRQPEQTQKPKKPVVSREDVVTVKMAGF